MDPGMSFFPGKERDAVFTNPANGFATCRAILVTKATRRVGVEPRNDAPRQHLYFDLPFA